jgi:hypothetical protein
MRLVPVTHHPLLLSSCALALLVGCGGGEDAGFDPASFLSSFAAPDPVSGTVLTIGFSGISGTTASQAAALLDTVKYLGTRVLIPEAQRYDPSITTEPFALQSSGAAFAHAAGVTGKNQLVAMSDEGISEGHETLAGKVTVDSDLPLASEHGTSVASVIVGEAAGFVGIAPDAELLFGTYGAGDSVAELTQLGIRALSEGAVAWNNSWGYVTTDRTTLHISETAVDEIFGSVAGQGYLAALRDFAGSGVVVFAMSNDERDRNAGLMDALPFLVPELEAGWLAVINGVPTLSGSTVTSLNLLSSPCWEAARWCLAAEGFYTAATGSGGDYEAVVGSSFAAPQVSGALALLAEAFPDLDPHALRVRLLASAEDDFFTPDATVELADGFFKGYSVIYGHGFLDIEAALRPIGATVMTLAEGGEVGTDAPVLRSGSAMGDAVERSLAGMDVAVRDALSAGFLMPADALSAGARPATRAGALLAKSLRADLTAERLAAPAALNDPFAAFTGPVLALAAPDGSASAAVLVPQNGSDGVGVTVSRAVTDGPLRIDLGIKLARDDGQLMSLGGDSPADMASVTFGITQDLGGGGFLALSGELGLTDLGGATVFGRAGTARFNAVKLQAGARDVLAAGDRLTLAVGLPVAITSGETVVDLPVVRTGAATFDSVALDLAPEDRQVDLELGYLAPLARGVEMKLSLIHSENFGNRAGARDTGAAVALAFRF